MFNFLNLTKPPVNIGSGVCDILLLAPVSWFADGGIKLPASGSGRGDQVVIFEEHIFKPGKGFFAMLLAPFRNELTAKTINQVPSQTLEQNLKIFFPGSYAELHEQVKNLLNTPLIALIGDAHCVDRLWYQLGNSEVYAYLTADFSTGTDKEGEKGYEAILSFINPFIQIYDAPIQKVLDNADSAVFLADLSNNFIEGDVNAMEAFYNNGLTSNINTIYDLLVEYATESIVHVAFANDQGVQLDEFLIPVDLTSLEDFVTSLYDWLALNVDDQYLEMSGSQLYLIDETAEKAFMGVAIPRNILGDDDFILLADDDTLIAVY